MKKTLAIFLSLVMLFSVFSVMATATDGTQTVSDAIEIDTAEEFLNIPTTGLDKNYILTKDITITSDAYSPIGDYTNRFKGTFDGNGKTITVDITCTNVVDTAEGGHTMAGAKYVGLFGATEDATIKNLTVKGEMTVAVAYGCIGGVVGAAFGETTVKNVVTDINMAVKLDDGDSKIEHLASNVGGVIGRIHRKNADTTDMVTVTVEDVYTLGTLFVDDNEENTGTAPAGDAEYVYGVAGTPVGGMIGLIGHLVDLQITRCVNFSDVRVSASGGNIAGIIGMNAYKVDGANPASKDMMKITMTWCANHGDVIRTYDNGERVSAIIACMQGTVAMENCYNSGVLSDSTGVDNYQKDTQMAGFFGNVSMCYMKNSFSTTFVDIFMVKATDTNRTNVAACTKNFVTSDCGTPAGATALDYVAGDSADRMYSLLVKEYEGEEMATKLEVREIEGERVICFNFVPAFTDSATVIEIDSAEEFAKIGNDAGYPLSGSYKLTADINVGNTMIGSYAAPFTGKFDGNGKTVTVDIDYTDLTTTNTVAGCANVGLFACIKNATICNVNVKGTMDVKTVCGYIGGLVGGSYGESNIYGCDVDVQMTLVLDGAAKAEIENAKNYASMVGGVVGMFQHSGTDMMQRSDVRNCVNRGDISVTSAATGTGTASTYSAGGNGGYGGIVGASGCTSQQGCMDVEITDCINYGDITVNMGAQNIGGIMGMTSTSGVSRATLFRCANYGDITRGLTYADRVTATVGYTRFCDVQYCMNAGNLDAGPKTHPDDETVTLTPLTAIIGHSTKLNRNHKNFSLTIADYFKSSKGTAILSAGNYYLSDQNASNTVGTALSVSSEATLVEIINAYVAAFANNDGMSSTFKAYGIYNTANGTGAYIGFSKPEGVTYYGYQTTNVSDGTYNIRFVSLVDSLVYEKVGYQIKGTYYDAAKQKNVTLVWNKECSTVYTSLTGSVDGTEIAYSVVGSDYIMALAITDVPVSVGEITFEITPYSVDDGVTTNGTAKTIVYTPAAE
ncbi:MAG: hypothetical protein IJ011_09745 [Clostridia bacterium]|nr:hypothetical protein [Clostridia bacterium]